MPVCNRSLQPRISSRSPSVPPRAQPTYLNAPPSFLPQFPSCLSCPALQAIDCGSNDAGGRPLITAPAGCRSTSWCLPPVFGPIIFGHPRPLSAGRCHAACPLVHHGRVSALSTEPLVAYEGEEETGKQVAPDFDWRKQWYPIAMARVSVPPLSNW